MHWKKGEKWFWECLLDADATSNSASWQWVAGTGTDSTLFLGFLILLRSPKKFDNDADYIRKFVPELRIFLQQHIFSPFDTDNNTLEQYGIVLRKKLSFPIVDYAIS